MAVIAFSSCKKTFEKDTTSPNLPATVPPSPLLRNTLNDMYNDPYADHGSHGGQAERNCQFFCSNYTYYGNNAYWDGVFHSQYATLNYGTITNVINMEAAAKSAAGSDNNPYNALGKFFRAWFFVNMSLKVGDLPMTQALQGATNLTPIYDSQKSIFIQANKWLDSANTEMAGIIQNGVFEFSGDSYYADFLGNSSPPALIKWQKAINTFRLRVLIELSKQAADPRPECTRAIRHDPRQFGKISDHDRYER